MGATQCFSGWDHFGRILENPGGVDRFNRADLLGSCDWTLTAVVLVAPIRTVAEAVAAEATDDAVDTISTGEEGRRTL